MDDTHAHGSTLPKEPDPSPDDLRQQLRTPKGAGPSTVTMVLAAVLIAAVGFFGGILVGKGMDDGQGAAFPQGGGQLGPGFGPGQDQGQLPGDGGQLPGSGGQQPGGFPAGDLVIGTITGVSGDSVTVETDDGQTVTVTVNDDTSITVTDEGSTSDLAEGESVVVAGDRQGDSVDANSINEGIGVGLGAAP